jgi:hypothetical protein
MALPIIPHEEFGADCCGCLVEIIGETTEYQCNERGAVIPPADVQRIVMEMPSVEEICPREDQSDRRLFGGVRFRVSPLRAGCESESAVMARSLSLRR